MRKISAIVWVGVLCAVLLLQQADLALAQDTDNNSVQIEVTEPQHQGVSPVVRGMAGDSPGAEMHREEKPIRNYPGAGSNKPNTNDPVTQNTATTLLTANTTSGAGFEGLGLNFTGPQGTFDMHYAPPDVTAAVGPNHYVQAVNASFAVFNKSGTVLYGPVHINTLFKGFGGGCEANNDGDAIVQYDRAADRWIITQFSISNANVYGYLQCLAVSQSADPLGKYNLYSFSYAQNMNDYPKLGIWPDGYYISYNMFRNGNSWLGPQVCVIDRAAILGQVNRKVTQQCHQFGTTVGGTIQPSDLDGSTPPPTGSPNYLVNYTSNALRMWKLQVNWTNSRQTKLTGPSLIPVAAFSASCGTCIPQPATTQKLDSMSDRLMYRLAYRNFGTYQALVVNHSVTTSMATPGGTEDVTGVRWYELRNLNATTPTVYQQSTFAPDATHRWMGSIAMDKQGNIGLGYSVSSASVYPSIRYTGRLVNDTLNTMQAETTMVDGSGTQNTNNLSRWGDYSSMRVDPSDDCTFWYSTEYLTTNGSWNWQTRIASFKFNGCQ